MRDELIEIVQKGMRLDINPREIVDAILDRLSNPDDAMVEAASCLDQDELIYTEYGYQSSLRDGAEVKVWRAMLSTLKGNSDE